MEGGLVHFLGRDIHFPHGFGPRRDSSCWFTPGVICSGGEGHNYKCLWECDLNTSETEWMSHYTVFHTRGGSVLDHHHLLRSTHRHGLRFGSDLLCQVQWPREHHRKCSLLVDNESNLLFVIVLLARRRINQIRMVRGPNKILLTLDDVTFINPSLSNKVSTFFCLQIGNITEGVGTFFTTFTVNSKSHRNWVWTTAESVVWGASLNAV